jgi:hypothetical protein
MDVSYSDLSEEEIDALENETLAKDNKWV